MKLLDVIKLNNYSVYSLAKKAGIPYSTLNDLVKGKTLIANLSLKYAIKLSDALNITPKMLLDLEQNKSVERVEFRYFRSNLLHEYKRNHNKGFAEKLIKSRIVDYYHKNGYLEETLYLIALIDTLCERYKMPKYTARFSSLRSKKLEKPFFPGSSLKQFETIKDAENQLNIKCLKEFKKYNIVENSIDDAC